MSGQCIPQELWDQITDVTSDFEVTQFYELIEEFLQNLFPNSTFWLEMLLVRVQEELMNYKGTLI
ncbi:MAG: hypothetical protein ACXADY_02490 [Candidatus Hodarchaeales archaeon]